MAHNYEEVKYSRSKVKKAGKDYLKPAISADEKKCALSIINNWRAAHAFPLQVIYMHLRKIAPKNAIVAQRMKRRYSITKKLRRYPNMSLTTMQDIGGCRVVVDNIQQVYDMVSRLKRSRMRHGRKEEYDYIKTPKADGYRSYHMVFSYYSEKNPKYNGLFIEVQIRSHLQHIWATAVEAMDAFTGDPLKIGEGSPENRQFFVLASRMLELYENNGNNLSRVWESDALKELLEYEKMHKILDRLETIKIAVDYVSQIDQKSQGYYLLRLNRSSGQLLIRQYSKKELEEATETYDLAEQDRTSGEDVVLVATSSFNMLKQAYPNYFVDISEFVALMRLFLRNHQS